MPTPAPPPQTALPSEADDPGVLADECVAVAARLVRAVRRRNPTDIARILASVPGGRVDALAVVLAGMVPADRGIAELLVWTVEPSLAAAAPTPGRHGSNEGYLRHRRDGTLVCRPCAIAHTVTSRPPACRAEFARLLEAGVGIERAAQLSEPAFLLRHAHRPAA